MLMLPNVAYTREADGHKNWKQKLTVKMLPNAMRKQ